MNVVRILTQLMSWLSGVIEHYDANIEESAQKLFKSKRKRDFMKLYKAD